MIDEDLTDTLLHINMSVKPENPESRLCVLVAFTCLHLCTSMSVNKYLLKHVRDIRVITKLPNSEQSDKGKVKTHKYINRQNQSTTGKL